MDWITLGDLSWKTVLPPLLGSISGGIVGAVIGFLGVRRNSSIARKYEEERRTSEQRDSRVRAVNRALLAIDAQFSFIDALFSVNRAEPSPLAWKGLTFNAKCLPRIQIEDLDFLMNVPRNHELFATLLTYQQACDHCLDSISRFATARAELFKAVDYNSVAHQFWSNSVESAEAAIREQDKTLRPRYEQAFKGLTDSLISVIPSFQPIFTKQSQKSAVPSQA